MAWWEIILPLPKSQSGQTQRSLRCLVTILHPHLHLSTCCSEVGFSPEKHSPPSLESFEKNEKLWPIFHTCFLRSCFLQGAIWTPICLVNPIFLLRNHSSCSRNSPPHPSFCCLCFDSAFPLLGYRQSQVSVHGLTSVELEYAELNVMIHLKGV